MHFTREPTVETVITPREGHKLVVRSSRGGGTEEYFVDALEVVVFGTSSFFRSLERPKSFLLPVRDYEVLEVRETRTVLKAVTVQKERAAARPSKPETPPVPAAEEKLLEKKRERRRQRRRRGPEEGGVEEAPAEEAAPAEPKPTRKRAPKKEKTPEEKAEAPEQLPEPEAVEEKKFDSIIPPPSFLISERMQKYEKAAPPEETPPADAEAKEAPELVPPEQKESGGFSPTRLFRRFRGGEESPSDEEK